MIPEFALLSKKLPDGLTAYLTQDPYSLNPHRSHENNDYITIVTFDEDSIRSDLTNISSREDFHIHLWKEVFPDLEDCNPDGVSAVEDLSEEILYKIDNTEYPGVIESIYTWGQDEINVSTSRPAHLPFPKHVGWAYVTAQKLQQEKLSKTQARANILIDLAQLRNHINNFVYELIIQNQQNDHQDSITEIHPTLVRKNPITQQLEITNDDFPKEEDLDKILLDWLHPPYTPEEIQRSNWEPTN